MLAFFGLTQEYSIELHKSIFNLVTFGKGGWTWEALYFQIPVYLRTFYFSEMVKVLEREKNESENTTSPGPTSGKVNIPSYLRK